MSKEILEELEAIRQHVEILIKRIKYDEGAAELWIFRSNDLISYVAVPMSMVDPVDCLFADSFETAKQFMRDRLTFKMWCLRSDIKAFEKAHVSFVLDRRPIVPLVPKGME